jgi:hypothetical protein
VKILKILKANDRKIRQPECQDASMLLYGKTVIYAATKVRTYGSVMRTILKRVDISEAK